MLNKIIDDAYKLYMPQVRSEITDLSKFLLEYFRYPPQSILEIGTKYGGTFYIWNSLWSNDIIENGVVFEKPTCISIDMSDGGIHGGISDEEMDKRDSWFLERFDNCHFVRGNSHENKTLAKMCNILFNDLKHDNNIRIVPWEEQRIDFLFIDGDHSYSGVKSDFDMYSPFVKTGGLIAFHDIIISEHHHSRNVFVGEFWNDLTQSQFRRLDQTNVVMINKIEYEIHEFIENQKQTWAGIGLLKKL